MAEGVLTTGTRRCVECGGEYSIIFFRPSRGESRASTPSTRRGPSRCIGCEQGERTRTARDDEYRKKARATRNRHSAKFVRIGVIEAPSELERLYGWSLDRMTHDIEQASRGACPYCGRSFATMGRGLRDVALDILDLRSLPGTGQTCAGAAVPATRRNSARHRVYGPPSWQCGRFGAITR